LAFFPFSMRSTSLFALSLPSASVISAASLQSSSAPDARTHRVCSPSMHDWITSLMELGLSCCSTKITFRGALGCAALGGTTMPLDVASRYAVHAAGVRNLTTAASEDEGRVKDSRAPPQIRGVRSDRRRPVTPLRMAVR
jgi:hypothetical protein